MLTDREQEIVALLRRDPLLDSEALAARLGTTRASINVHLSNLRKKGVVLGRGYVLAERPGAVVVGGANLDVKARSEAPATHGTSNPGHGSMTPGGVGRNVAENLARLGDRVELVSVVGRDPAGDQLLQLTSGAGVGVEHVARIDGRTGTYTAVLDANGELLVAIADMDAMDEFGTAQIDAARDTISTAGVVVIDGNVSRAVLDYVLDLAANARVVFEPVSVPKATRLAASVDGRIDVVTPNRDELGALTGLPTRTPSQVGVAARSLHDRGVGLVWVRLGAQGSVLSTAAGTTEVPAHPAEVIDVTGAGDAMLGAFCHVLLDGGSDETAARFGHAAAALTVASTSTVRPDLTDRLVRDTLHRQEQP
jgi:pseudouridine kinase